MRALPRMPLYLVLTLVASRALAAESTPAPPPPPDQMPAEVPPPAALPPSAPAASATMPPPALPAIPPTITPTPMAASAPKLEPATGAPAPLFAPGPSPLKVEDARGDSVHIGLLLQPQFQSANSTTLDGYSNNLYLRRTRILLGGTLLGTFEYFLDTDYPNLFLSTPEAGTNGAANTNPKNTPGMNIQDAFATWKAWKDMLKIDAGYMLPPLAHNAVQGATTLYAWDYFSYSFQQGNALGSSGNPVGRDLGVQARGLLLDGHLEYRAGLFQGFRDVASDSQVAARNFFRFTARIQVNLLDPEPGFFYQGSYLGARKILSVGGSVDIQDSYRYYAGDIFADLPVGPLGVGTAQLNVTHLTGGTLVPALPEETAVMAEAGFIFAAAQTGPILRFEHLSVTGGQDQTRYVGGLAYWPFGHNSNVKAFYTRLHEDGASRDINQFNLQWQLYFY